MAEGFGSNAGAIRDKKYRAFGFGWITGVGVRHYSLSKNYCKKYERTTGKTDCPL
jgi:hypothetical protein